MPHAEAAPTANSRSGYAETVKSSGVKSEHTRGGEGGTAWCQLLSLLPASRSLTYQSGWRHKLALWGWDHKKNTHSTVARYGQGMRSWLCSQGNADLPPPKQGLTGHPDTPSLRPRQPAGLTGAGVPAGCWCWAWLCSPRVWAWGSTGGPFLHMKQDPQSSPHKVHSLNGKSRVQRRMRHQTQAPGRSPDTKTQPTGS